VNDETRQEIAYNVVDASTSRILSRHRTQTAVADTWRRQRTGNECSIIHRDCRRDQKLIVKGAWREAARNSMTWLRRRPVDWPLAW